MNDNFSYISGPISLASFNLDGRKFYFFGDKHFSKEMNCESIVPCLKSKKSKNSQSCYDFVYFLDQIFQNAQRKNEYIDFFLETPFVLKNMRFSDIDTDYISSIEKKFRDCLRRDKKKCKYKNTRFHYIDFRIKNSTDISSINYIPLLFIKNIQKRKSKSEREKDIFFYNLVTKRLFSKKINKQLFDSYFQDNFDYSWSKIIRSLFRGLSATKYKSQFREVSKIFQRALKYYKIRNGKIVHLLKSQFDSLKQDGIQHKGKYMSDIIQKYISDLYKNIDFDMIRKYWSQLIHTVKKKKKIPKELLSPTKSGLDLQLSNLIELIYDLDTHLFDAYLLTRMFRIFKYTKREEHIPSKMVISFTGNYHNNRYIDFFTNTLGLTSELYVESINNKELKRCLYSPKFKREFE